MTKQLVVDVMLECTDFLEVPVESVVLVPKIGQEIICAKCKQPRKIIKVGSPYPVEVVDEHKPDPLQGEMKT